MAAWDFPVHVLPVCVGFLQVLHMFWPIGDNKSPQWTVVCAPLYSLDHWLGMKQVKKMAGWMISCWGRSYSKPQTHPAAALSSCMSSFCLKDS